MPKTTRNEGMLPRVKISERNSVKGSLYQPRAYSAGMGNLHPVTSVELVRRSTHPDLIFEINYKYFINNNSFSVTDGINVKGNDYPFDLKVQF